MILGKSIQKLDSPVDAKNVNQNMENPGRN
jgi:hypothetical protein